MEDFMRRYTWQLAALPLIAVLLVALGLFG
jgi:hypothetical protein